MSFEVPNFNNEPSEHERGLITPEFLREQTHLPRNQWNEKFRQLIEEKTKENQQAQKGVQEEKIEESPEVLREHTFKRYTDGLGLSEESLRGKRVLDLGSGEGEFVKSLIEKGITLEAYGIDAELNEVIIEDRFKKHFLQGNFEEDLLIKNIDYVVSVGAVSNGVWGGEEVMNISRIIENSLASLKEDGEIRIYPIQEATEATSLVGLQASKEKWKELLTEISDKQKVEYRVEPRNIKVCGDNNDIILESVLIIRKKSIKRLNVI